MVKNPTMNFQAYLEDAWKIIKKEPLILIGGGFLYQLLFYLTQGFIVLVAGPLLGGYLLLIILYLRENRRPAFNDLFTGFKQFGSLFPYFLVLLIIFIGFALLIIPGLVFVTWWIYVLPLMVDRKMSFGDAMRMSMNKVNETGFFMHLAFLLLVTLVPILILTILSATVPFLTVLSVLLTPMQFGCLASLYLDKFRPDEPAIPHDAVEEPAAEEIFSPQAEDIAAEQVPEAGEDKPETDETPADAGIESDEAVESSKKEEKQENT